VYLAKPQADEFYKALKTNDYSTLQKFYESFEYREINNAVRSILIEKLNIVDKTKSKSSEKQKPITTDTGYER